MKSLVLITIMVLATATPALADGGFFAPWINEIYEHEQVALLDWNAADAIEILTILPGFHGDMPEFAWVVPVPAEPELNAGRRALFDDLFAATRPIYRQREEGWGCERASVDYLTRANDGGVEVLQQDLVGIYEVMVLAADEAASLTDSLEVWGYLHDGNRDLAEPILADYVERGWVFVTLRVDSTAFAESFPEFPQYGGWWGGMEPIELTFPVDAPIYPMRISAVSTTPRARVTVFCVSDERLTFVGARTRYANRLSEEELGEIAEHWPDAAAKLSAGRFLTRLERTMGAADMDVDLALVRSPGQEEFRPISYSSPGGSWWFLGSVLVVWGLGRRVVRRWHGRWVSG